MSRRQFLTRVSLALGAWGTAIVAVPIVGFVLSPLVRKPPQVWRAVGALDAFPPGQTVQVTFLDPSPLPWAGVSARAAAWVRRDGEQQFVAFAVNCTHLGCPVRWLPDAGLFMCPCHGGVYYEDGARASGPPERGLFEYAYKVEDGKLYIKAGELPTPSSPSKSSGLVDISGKLPCA